MPEIYTEFVEKYGFAASPRLYEESTTA